MRLFDERYSVEGMAVQLRREAFKGVFTGKNDQKSMEYVKRCTAMHGPSWSHVIFNREEGVHETLKFRTFQRCFTLILTFVNPVTRDKLYDPVRAHPWVTALFGPYTDAAWIERGAVGTPTRALHLWADEKWKPIWVPNQQQADALAQAGWRPYEFPPQSTCIAPEATVQSN